MAAAPMTLRGRGRRWRWRRGPFPYMIFPFVPSERADWTQSPSRSVRSERMERRSEEHTSELQSLMRISYAVFCLKKKKNKTKHTNTVISSNAQEEHPVEV